MLTKNHILSKYTGFGEGIKVRSRDDENLGKVISLADDSFTIEKGYFFPKDFTVRYDDVSDVRDNVVYLNLTKADLETWKEPSYAGWNQVDMINRGQLEATPAPEYRDRYPHFGKRKEETTGARHGLTGSEEVRVPIAEEELEARKISREAGAVRLHKVVHTELRHFTVPVMKEEVRVERVPVSEAREATQGERVFKEDTVSIPVREEQVEVVKKPVVKEEIRVTKERTEEPREVSGEIRKEEVKIDKAELEKRKKTA